MAACAVLVIGAATAYVAARVAASKRQAVLGEEASPSVKVRHPNLSHLRRADGREVVLIGTLPLDLDGVSRDLVGGAVRALQPDVVMVEGTWAAGLNAMFLSGTWQLHGVQPPSGTNWTEGVEVAPVELPKMKRRSFLGLFGGGSSSTLRARSVVPVKVSEWAHNLRGAVGGDISAAVTTAAARGVPVLFLGPDEGGFQGHMQVMLLAKRAVQELLEAESHSGMQMPVADVDAALRRAEKRVREDAGKWLKDMRGETTRMMSDVRTDAPPEVREEVLKQFEKRALSVAERIATTMQEYRRAAVVVSMDQVIGIEGELMKAGYKYVSDCI